MYIHTYIHYTTLYSIIHISIDKQNTLRYLHSWKIHIPNPFASKTPRDRIVLTEKPRFGDAARIQRPCGFAQATVFPVNSHGFKTHEESDGNRWESHGQMEVHSWESHRTKLVTGLLWIACARNITTVDTIVSLPNIDLLEQNIFHHEHGEMNQNIGRWANMTCQGYTTHSPLPNRSGCPVEYQFHAIS